MSEIQNQPFQLSFNASLKVDFQGSRVTSDGSLILVRELDERLGFGELIEQHLTDSRRGKNTRFPFADPAERDGNPSIVTSLVRKTSTMPRGSPRTRPSGCAAAVGEDRRSAGETCPLLLATPGRESSDAPFVWEHGAMDRGASGSSGVALSRWQVKSLVKKGGRDG
jgi:hypothetical protein